jgi:hypothetical protein
MRGPITTITFGFWTVSTAAMSMGRTAAISTTGNARSAKAALLTYMKGRPSLKSEWHSSASTQNSLRVTKPACRKFALCRNLVAKALKQH